MKTINENAPVATRKNIIINAKPERIWNVLTDIDKWPNWQTEITFARMHGPLQPNIAFTWKSGGMKINSILHTVAPFYHLGWTGKAFGLNAIHNWILKVAEGGTEVTTSESMEGLLARVLKGKLQKTLDKNLEHWLELLKNECEKGEE